MLSVIIVTYNSSAHLPACFESLKSAAQSVDAEITIWDNASPEGRPREITAAYGFRLLEGRDNVGFARACNAAAETAQGDLLLFLNPDTVLESDSLVELIAASISRPNAGLYGSLLVGSGGTETHSALALPSMVQAIAFALGIARLVDFKVARDTAGPYLAVPALPGTSLMVTAHAWQQLGGFSERYFMYSEDVDLCKRARDAGYTPTLCLRSRVQHAVGGSSPGVSRESAILRGRTTYARLHWGPVRQTAQRALLLLGVVLRANSPVRQNRDRSFWKAVWQVRNQWLQPWPESLTPSPNGDHG